MGLFNIKLQDPDFYANVREDTVVTIDKDQKKITIEGYDKVFFYQQSQVEETLLDAGGVLPLYKQFSTNVFRQITKQAPKTSVKRKSQDGTEMNEARRPQTGGMDW